MLTVLHQTHEDRHTHVLTQTRAAQMSQRVLWQIGFTMHCPHYCYQGNQAPFNNHPVLPFFLKWERKRGRGLGRKEWRGNDRTDRRCIKTSLTCAFTALWLSLMSLWVWTDEPHISVLFHHLNCLSCFGTEVMMTSEKLFPICRLYILPHLAL